MSQSDLAHRPAADGALSSFLARSVVYEKAGAVIPRDLVQFGLLASGAVFVTGLMALLLPGAASIRHGGFFLLFASQEAGLETLMHTLALPAIFLASALFALDVCLMKGRRSERWRSAIVAQAVAGGVGGVICTLFLALLILNLAIWIALIGLVLAALCAMLAAAGS